MSNENINNIRGKENINNSSAKIDEVKKIKDTTGEADDATDVKETTALEALFCVRDRQLVCITDEDKESTKELTHKIQEQERKIRKELEKSQLKEDVAQKIIDIFEMYQTLSNDRNVYFNKKYYIAGFDDGAKIILRNVNKQ